MGHGAVRGPPLDAFVEGLTVPYICTLVYNGYPKDVLRVASRRDSSPQAAVHYVAMVILGQAPQGLSVVSANQWEEVNVPLQTSKWCHFWKK